MDNNLSNPLDDNNINIEEYYKSYIKNRSIDDLINQDNKIFAEIKELESEKHYLVTQNYKKFVSATETINFIKSSLIGFESNIKNLKDKVDSIVKNFNTINNSMEEKLKTANETYKIKKDLKRLKFINDLPDILESKLNEFSANSDKKDIKIFEKSLSYYERCKDFLIMHKENPLVKGIYIKTKQLIAVYRSYINDDIQPEVNEAGLKNFEFCLKLLVKIEDEKTDLISTFISIYKSVISKRFDEIFAMKENNFEIDFLTYTKIYDNFEFGINENEFIFYEKEIKEMNTKDNKDNNNLSKDIKLSSITSKKLKKGTLIWMVKKIVESIFPFINSSYESFVNLFGKESTFEINKLLIMIIETYFKKVNDVVLNTNDIDCIFFKESLTCFLYPFCENLQKINDDSLQFDELTDKIICENRAVTNIYLRNIYLIFLEKNCNFIRDSLNKVNSQLQSNKFSKQYFINEAQNLYKKSLDSILDFTNLLKVIKLYIQQLDFQEIFRISSSLANEEINKYIMLLNELFNMLLKSSNLIGFEYHLSNLQSYISSEDYNIYKNLILRKLDNESKESIYLRISLNKLYINNLKEYLDKTYKMIPVIKNFNKNNEIDKAFKNRFVENLNLILNSLLQLKDQLIFSKLKELFFDVDWLNYSEPIAYRFEIKELCINLLELKNEIEHLLEEEKKGYDERKSVVLTENFLGKKHKTISKIKKEMESLAIRKLSIYEQNSSSPQDLLVGLAKILLKTINEFIKLKRFSKNGYQQIHIDVNFMRLFLKEYLIKDDQTLLVGFILEIMQNCSHNSITYENYDESLIQSMFDSFKMEFKKMEI